MVTKIDKKAQASIFIILGILLISIVVLFLFVKNVKVPEIGKQEEINPNIFIDSCMEGKIKESIDTFLSRGGYLKNPLHKSFKFEDEQEYYKISYLCYNINYYFPCINQDPMLIQNIKKRMEENISVQIEKCFNELVITLEDKSYVVEPEYRGFEVKLKPGKVVADIDAKITLTKSGETSKIEEFRVVVLSKIYDLAIVAQEIVSQEAEYCNFNSLGYMLNYPKIKIEKFRTSDSDIIYRVRHDYSDEEFKFAVRGCVIPPGI